MNLISFNQITSTSKESITKIGGNKGSVISNVGKEIEVFDEERHLNRVNPNVKDLYLELKERISSWDDVRFNSKKRYVSVSRGNKIKIYLNLQKERIKIHLLRRISFKGDVNSSKISFTLKDPNKIFKLLKRKNREQYQYFLKDDKDLDYLVLLLKQKYDS